MATVRGCGGVCNSPQLWMTLIFVVGVSVVALSTYQVAKTCYRPEHSNVINCADKLELAHQEWSTFVIGFLFIVVTSSILAFLRLYHKFCGGQTVGDTISVLTSFVATIFVTIYAHFTVAALQSTPHVDDTVVPACVVCAASDTNAYYGLIWVGVATLWAGTLVGGVLACMRPARSIAYMELVEQLRNDAAVERTPNRKGEAATVDVTELQTMEAATPAAAAAASTSENSV
jgi:hypothetical protein